MTGTESTTGTSGSPASCPGCGSGPFEVELDVTDWDETEDVQTLALLMFTDGRVAATGPDGQDAPVDGHDGTDAFVGARCLACGLSLVNESGETRLRRAVAKQQPSGSSDWADAGWMGSGGSPDADLTDAQHAALFALAERAIGTVPTPRTVA